MRATSPGGLNQSTITGKTDVAAGAFIEVKPDNAGSTGLITYASEEGAPLLDLVYHDGVTFERLADNDAASFLAGPGAIAINTIRWVRATNRAGGAALISWAAVVLS